MVAFGVWEKFFAPLSFIPFHLLKNRTVIFTYIMAGSLYVGWWIWDTMFLSVLLVMFNVEPRKATYITNTYTMGSVFISIVYGVCLRYYGRLKMYSLFWGVPLTILGVGLMIHFRQPDVNIGYVVMCHIFIAFGGGVLVISEQTTLMAVSKQEHFPALLATEAMIISIGSSIGQSIAGAMWNNIFPEQLLKNLPASIVGQMKTIMDDIAVQQSYAWGTPERDAINKSYGDAQKLMLITATCVYIITFVSVALWEDVDVRKIKQRTFGLL
jgi:hypothetical protein